MQTKLNWAIPALLLLLLVAASGSLYAHNGEYLPPEGLRAPPRLTPTETGSTPSAGRPLSSPTQLDRPGVITPGSLTPKKTSAEPDTVRQETAISWEALFDVLRRGLPDHPPIATRELRERVRVALVGRLEDESLEVRRFVVLSLGRIGAFDDASSAVRDDPVAARGISLLGPGLAYRAPLFECVGPPIKETLLPVLTDRAAGSFARGSAAISLALGGPSEASALLDAMQDCEAGPLRDVFLFALGLSGHPGAHSLLLDRVLPPKDRGIRGNPAQRALLLHAMSRIPGPDVTRDLVRRLTDPSMKVRAAAALSLAGRTDGSQGGRVALRGLAFTAPARPRSAALVALARLGDVKAAGLARLALGDVSCRGNGTAAVAALTLGLMASAEDGPDLVAVFADTGASADLRKAAAVAAGLVRARDSAELMTAVIRKERDPLVASFGILGLSLLDGRAAAPLIEKALARTEQDAVRRLMVIALGYAGGERAEELLVKAYGDNYFVNREAPLALYRLNPERAIGELLSRLADEKNLWSRRFAAIALGRCLDTEFPSFFGTVLLGTGLGGQTPVEHLMFYLESGS